jgi:hypothetical protein
MFSRILFLFLFGSMSSLSFAQNTISDTICEMYEGMMSNVVLSYRQQGLPVSIAESTFDSEEDIRTRVFLKRVAREIYANPEKGREYITSGQFRQACVTTHRGF